MRNAIRLAALVVSVWLAPLAASAVSMDYVFVGNPGNACDPQSQGCFGTVASSYFISKYEVTNAQYVEFLNAKAAADPLGVYNTVMGSDATLGGITRSGVSGSFTYSAKLGFENKPVNYVSFYDAARFTNWLNNGQGAASTESGAYLLLGGTAVPSNGTSVVRSALATTFLPSEDEWYKAAYYSPSGVYFDFAAGSNTIVCAAPTATPNRANCGGAIGLVTTLVGAYTGSPSPYGTFDQTGNVMEWEDTNITGNRPTRGGAYGDSGPFLNAAFRNHGSPVLETSYIGFRVASTVPEPSSGLLVAVGLLGLARHRRRRH